DPGGRNLLAFHGTLTPNAIPSTVVIDRDGRVAASILGEVTSATTLVDLVDEVTGGAT
ncbi:MAG TPA: TlpA family protein disulfide reductase, partial [Marmoricola sp.]